MRRIILLITIAVAMVALMSFAAVSAFANHGIPHGIGSKCTGERNAGKHASPPPFTGPCP
jgi:hypothetical protein